MYAAGPPTHPYPASNPRWVRWAVGTAAVAGVTVAGYFAWQWHRRARRRAKFGGIEAQRYLCEVAQDREICLWSNADKTRYTYTVDGRPAPIWYGTESEALRHAQMAAGTVTEGSMAPDAVPPPAVSPPVPPPAPVPPPVAPPTEPAPPAEPEPPPAATPTVPQSGPASAPVNRLKFLELTDRLGDVAAEQGMGIPAAQMLIEATLLSWQAANKYLDVIKQTARPDDAQIIDFAQHLLDQAWTNIGKARNVCCEPGQEPTEADLDAFVWTLTDPLQRTLAASNTLSQRTDEASRTWVQQQVFGDADTAWPVPPVLYLEQLAAALPEPMSTGVLSLTAEAETWKV